MKILDKIFKSKVYIANKYLYVQNRASEYYVRIYLGDKLLLIEFNKWHMIKILWKHGMRLQAIFNYGTNSLDYNVSYKVCLFNTTHFETYRKEKGMVLYGKNNPIKTRILYKILKQV